MRPCLSMKSWPPFPKPSYGSSLSQDHWKTAAIESKHDAKDNIHHALLVQSKMRLIIEKPNKFHSRWKSDQFWMQRSIQSISVYLARYVTLRFNFLMPIPHCDIWSAGLSFEPRAEERTRATEVSGITPKRWQVELEPLYIRMANHQEHR